LKQESNTEFEKFDTVVKKMMSTSREELQRREKAWKQKRARLRKKRAKD